jgi:hypothetical protein
MVTMKKLCMMIALTTLISACSFKEHKIICDEVERVKLELTNPKHLTLNDVKFHVITEENVYNLFQSLKESNQQPVLYALTEDGYKSLSLNVNEMKRYILESKLILHKYREYYESK